MLRFDCAAFRLCACVAQYLTGNLIHVDSTSETASSTDNDLDLRSFCDEGQCAKSLFGFRRDSRPKLPGQSFQAKGFARALEISISV